MACETKTYPLDSAKAQSICNAIFTESGIQINPAAPTGIAETHGVHLAWTIAAGEITISIASKPLFIGCDTIYAQLDKLFTEAT